MNDDLFRNLPERDAEFYARRPLKPPRITGQFERDPVILDARESAAKTDEERLEREGRFTPYDNSLPADLYRVDERGRAFHLDGTPWGQGRQYRAERYERIRIANLAVDAGLRGVEVDEAVDLTLFAQSFERWVESGCPLGR